MSATHPYQTPGPRAATAGGSSAHMPQPGPDVVPPLPPLPLPPEPEQPPPDIIEPPKPGDDVPVVEPGRPKPTRQHSHKKCLH
ncbi:MAG: hypothetical protein ABI633_02130 [Burkholderiales bacterium]